MKPFEGRNNDLKPRKNETEVAELANENTRPLDLRLDGESMVLNEISKASASDGIRELQDTQRKSSSASESLHTNMLYNKQDGNQSKEFNKEPPSPTALLWEKTVAGVKEHAITKLQDELKKAHDELKLKDEEVARLSRFRLDVELELEELTASLFQVWRTDFLFFIDGRLFL